MNDSVILFTELKCKGNKYGRNRRTSPSNQAIFFFTCTYLGSECLQCPSKIWKYLFEMKCLWNRNGNGSHPFFWTKTAWTSEPSEPGGQGVIPPLKVLAALETKHSGSKRLPPTPKDFPTFWMSQLLIIISILCSPIQIGKVKSSQ